MKKIVFSNYKTENGTDYDVKLVIKVILFAEELRLNSLNLIKHCEIWDKIKDLNDEYVFEDADYNELKMCIDKFAGYGLEDRKFVQAFSNPETIEVKEVK